MISVDWAPLAGPAPWYGVAVANARNVGARAGKMLSFLKENVQLSYDDVHVLGFRSEPFTFFPVHHCMLPQQKFCPFPNTYFIK